MLININWYRIFWYSCSDNDIVITILLNSALLLLLVEWVYVSWPQKPIDIRMEWIFSEFHENHMKWLFKESSSISYGQEGQSIKYLRIEIISIICYLWK